MKALALLLTLIFCADAMAGLPPTTLSGQAQTTKPTTFTFKTPNNQSTQVSGIESLIETGNTNILTNPGFEHSTYTTGWTTTGTTATLSAETSTIIHGKKALKAVSSSQNIAIVQDSTLYQASFSGVQGFVKAWISNTAPSVSMCARAAGVTLTGNNCVTLATDGLWKEYVIPVVLSATSNGISIAATSVTGTTIVDEAFVGVVPNAMPEVSQPQLAVEAYIAGTTNCTGWTRTNTALGAFASDADCPGPTIVVNNIGSAQTTDSDLPRFTVNSLPPGQYVATFIVMSAMSGVAVQSFAIFDGSSTCYAQPGNTTTGSLTTTVTCSFTYTSSGNRSFELYGASGSGTITLVNGNTAPAQGTRFILEYYPPASKVYSQPNNQDTDWVDCGLTTADFNGLGTVTGIEDLCKKHGSDLLMRVKFTSGTSTANEMRINLRLLGTLLTSAGTSVIPTIQLAGVAGTTANGQIGYFPLIEPSVSYITFGRSDATQNILTKLNGSSVIASGTSMSIVARVPINGWTQSQITGTFANVVTAPGVSKPKKVSAIYGGASATLAAPTECTTGVCVEISDPAQVFTPPSGDGSGNYTNVIIANGTFAASSPVRCSCVSYDATAATGRVCWPYFDTGDNSISSNASGGYTGNFFTRDAAGASATSYFQIDCEGQAP